MRIVICNTKNKTSLELNIRHNDHVVFIYKTPLAIEERNANNKKVS